MSNFYQSFKFLVFFKHCFRIMGAQGDIEGFDMFDLEDTTIKSLQLLRAMIHNEERKLPAYWMENPNKHIK